MSNERKKIRSAVSREQAESYLLTSLVAFAATVILTRARPTGALLLPVPVFGDYGYPATIGFLAYPACLPAMVPE